MDNVQIIENKAFVKKNQDGFMKVQYWGENTVRITVSPLLNMVDELHFGYDELEKNNENSEVQIKQTSKSIKLVNGLLTASFDGNKLEFFNKDKLVLKEYSRIQSDVRRTIGIDCDKPIEDLPTSSLNIKPYTFKYLADNSYEAILRFEGDSEERIYGLGGYQEEIINKNGSNYELMQRNSQTSIPFYLSNKNYGFLWNHASIGEVEFGFNQKKWVANNSNCIDYIITVGETPKEVLSNFINMTGLPPMIDTDLLGLWQSKLRYQTIDEISEVYDLYLNRGVRPSVMVIDYYHWTADGNFEFDMKYWHGIKDLANRMKDTRTKLMVSLWPTVSQDCKYYSDYQDNQMMLRNIHGKHNMFNNLEILDFTNPLTVSKVRNLIEQNYRNNGIELFWADQAEPEMNVYSHAEYLSYKGNLEKIGNEFPLHYIKAIQNDDNNNKIKGFPLLVRSAWLGAQKYGALVWSGDIESSFTSFKRQIQVALSMGLSGISWWTSDIAGFHSGDSSTNEFKELLIRWFQFATFSPILRMHGDRQPHTQKIGNSGGGVRTSGSPNEIWSFGTDVENILLKYIKIREGIQNYLESVFLETHETGIPIMRPLFLEYPTDKSVWNESNNFLLGKDLLICPITDSHIKTVEIYLPNEKEWIDVNNGKKYRGGQNIIQKVNINTIPVFCNAKSNYLDSLLKAFDIK